MTAPDGIDVQAFLAAARLPAGDDERGKDAVRARLASALGPAALGSPDPSRAALRAIPGGPVRGLALAKSIALLAVGFGLGMVSHAALDARRGATPSPVLAATAPAAPATSAPAAAVPRSIPVLQVEALAAAPLSRTPSFPSSPSSSSAVSQVPRSRESTSAHVVDPSADLAAEQVVLDAARTALERGDAAHALEEVQRHERRFPAGQLREEREGVRIAVLVAMGQKDAARAQLARFHRQFPSSLQGRALDALLGDGR